MVNVGCWIIDSDKISIIYYPLSIIYYLKT